MGLFGRRNNNSDSNNVVWRDLFGNIVCPGNKCKKECDNTCPIYLNTQAMGLMMSGRGAAAIPLYKEAVKIAPDFYDAWNNMGALYGGQRDYESAYDCYIKAHECKPKRPQPLFGLALVTRDLKRYDECVKWCDEYEALAGDNKTDSIRKIAEESLRTGQNGFISPAESKATAIVIKLLNDDRTSQIMDYRGGFPNIPEIMMQAGPVCHDILVDMLNEEEDQYRALFLSHVWCAYAGMGAVALWNDDWDELKKTGIIPALTKERGYFAMDEFVMDYTGIGWDSEECKSIQKSLRAFSEELIVQVIELSEGLGTDIMMETLKAMYLYGMVLEMSRLGMH